MSTALPVATRNLDGYGTPPIEWQRVLGDLEGGYTQAPDTGGPNRHDAGGDSSVRAVSHAPPGSASCHATPIGVACDSLCSSDRRWGRSARRLKVAPTRGGPWRACDRSRRR
jgi:hypothetical protein